MLWIRPWTSRSGLFPSPNGIVLLICLRCPHYRFRDGKPFNGSANCDWGPLYKQVKNQNSQTQTTTYILFFLFFFKQTACTHSFFLNIDFSATLNGEETALEPPRRPSAKRFFVLCCVLFLALFVERFLCRAARCPPLPCTSRHGLSQKHAHVKRVREIQ